MFIWFQFGAKLKGTTHAVDRFLTCFSIFLALLYHKGIKEGTYIPQIMQNKS